MVEKIHWAENVTTFKRFNNDKISQHLKESKLKKNVKEKTNEKHK